MDNEKTLSFDQALKGLELAAEGIRREDTGLEESMELYRSGMEYYRLCKSLLAEAEQKIEIYNEELQKTEEF